MTTRKGFSLVELMVALAVLGVLTALVLPVINNSSPSRSRMMMKKAFYTIEEIVKELINDEQYYPETDADGNTYFGFDNTLNTCNGIADLGNTCSGLSKFAKLFIYQLNSDYEKSEITNGFKIETNDGILWNISGQNTTPEEVTAAGDAGITQVIIVDVNGDKKPNCMQGDDACSGRNSDFDRFKVYVTRRGKVVPASGQPWFERAISIDSSVNGD